MAIIINIDVMLAKRKMSVTELSERVGITMANISDFNRFSKLYHVTTQAPAEYRVNAESLHHMYVRATMAACRL